MADFADDRTEMPVSAHLFALCGRGLEEAWPLPGVLVGDSAHFSLSSLGRKRLGSGPLKKIPTGWVGRYKLDIAFRGGRLPYSNPLHSRKRSGTRPGGSDT